jgi:hypothetical protein
VALTSTTFKIVTTWSRRSGIPKDAVMNTWHYTAPSAAPSTQDYTNWEQGYKAFLIGIAPHMSQCLGTLATDLKIQFYQLPNTPGGVGVPKHEIITAPPAPGAFGSLPGEVSVVLTMLSYLTGVPEHGPGGTRPASSRRNRVFLGPLDSGIVFQDTQTSEATVSAQAMDTITNSWVTHMAHDQQINNWVPVTFSRKSWTTAQTAQCYVDNAFDTQRRRGNDPTARATKVVGG